MWLLILAGFLAVSAAKETEVATSADDVILLEMDAAVKEPSKRSPIQASAVYGASPSQYIIRHGDDAQELSPEYLSLVQQYTQTQAQAAQPQRRPALPAYARQQQQLQQAYYNFRKPAVVPPRPRLQLHPQALAQAEVAAEAQAQIDTRSRAEAVENARSVAPAYQVPAYQDASKLGTFEQELLQLVSANQAQEFNLLAAQPKRAQLLKAEEAYTSPYAQQLVAYPETQYAKAPEQYHIETTAPRYQQPQQQQHYAKPVKEFRPSPEYQAYAEENNAQLQQQQQQQARAEAEDIARAQAHAEAQALAYQKVAQASHKKHQQDAFEQIRIVNERYREQQSALEQIEQGSQVSDAGKAHNEEQQVRPKDPEAAYRARLKAQAAAEAAEARRAQEAAEYKAHADAILKLQAQQQAHLKAQEEAHQNALNFERNQLRAQAQAQALAQAQAEALYKAHQAARAKANSEAAAAARAQAEARKIDPENTPVVQYLLPTNVPLPSPNSYLSNANLQKYQQASAAGSTYVARSAPSTTPSPVAQGITQPRQAHKLKVPSSSQASSLYVSQSGLLKKAPVKSLTIEEIIEQDQISSPRPQLIRIPNPKGPQTITQEDLAALINAGYTVTPVPVPQAVKPTAAAQQAYVPTENSSVGYYVKKLQQRVPVARPDYVSYEDELVQRPRIPIRKTRPILRQDEGDGTASEKLTFLLPIEPVFGTKQSASAATQ
ncbi:uncharacterized protein [Prorops nasuta]|uniref:uncharacterized protein n=1 Tax=Prorops nasuta TaxID=863751 RepID=UPI0034CF29FB